MSSPNADDPGGGDRGSGVTARHPVLAVTRLTVTRFRCYGAARLDLDPRPVVLTGDNGAGKTNLLEAVSLLTPGRGLRNARLSELARVDAARSEGAPGGWAVAATLSNGGDVVEIGTGVEPPAGGTHGGEGRAQPERERRLVRIDGEPARGQTALADHVRAVWLTPQMDRLFLDGAAARRRFVDRLVFGFDPAHAGRLGRYEHALRERATLLRERRGDAHWLSALEDQMATTGVAVAAARRDVVGRLARAAARGLGPFPGVVLDMDGAVERWVGEMPALTAEDMLREALLANRNGDAMSGGASMGPHRADLLAFHAAKGAPAALCSTGEQKAMLIAITLANARLLTAERGSAPLILLDEVAAHLDRERRDALFAELSDLSAQAWLTGTDAAVFAPLAGAANWFSVDEGRVSPAPGNSL